MNDWRDILEREYQGEAGSFLFQLRCGPGWDKDSFNRLFVAMRACCNALDDASDIPRWIADLFWQLDWSVRRDIDRRWPKKDSAPDYYENAWTNVNHLAHWLFTGEGRSDNEFEPMEPK